MLKMVGKSDDGLCRCFRGGMVEMIFLGYVLTASYIIHSQIPILPIWLVVFLFIAGSVKAHGSGWRIKCGHCADQLARKNQTHSSKNVERAPDVRNATPPGIVTRTYPETDGDSIMTVESSSSTSLVSSEDSLDEMEMDYWDLRNLEAMQFWSHHSLPDPDLWRPSWRWRERPDLKFKSDYEVFSRGRPDIVDFYPDHDDSMI